MRTFPIFIAAALAVATQTVRASEITTAAGKVSASTRARQPAQIFPAPASKDPELKNKDKDFGKASTATSPGPAREQGEAAQERMTNDAAETKAEDRELEQATKKQAKTQRAAAAIEAGKAARK